MGKSSKSKNKKYVKVEDIPENDEELSESENELMNSVFSIKNTNPKEYNGRFKYVLFASIAFIVLSLPVLDRLIEMAVPLANSWPILLGIKSVLFFCTFYLIWYANDH